MGKIGMCDGKTEIMWVGLVNGEPYHIWVKCTKCGQVYVNNNFVDEPLDWRVALLGGGGKERGHTWYISKRLVDEYVASHDETAMPMHKIDMHVLDMNTPNTSNDMQAQENLSNIVRMHSDWEISLFDPLDEMVDEDVLSDMINEDLTATIAFEDGDISWENFAKIFGVPEPPTPQDEEGEGGEDPDVPDVFKDYISTLDF